MTGLTIFLTIIVYLAALYVRKLKIRENLTSDYFALFLVGSFMYNCLGQLTTMQHDDTTSQEMLLFAFFILGNSIVLFVAAIFFPKYELWKSAPSVLLPTKYIMIGLMALTVGYLFWHLNYARVGGIIQSFYETTNRVDRNAALTEQRGNLPYVHFFFVANVFLYYGFLVQSKNIKKSVFKTCLLMAPLLAFFLFEGERSSILKHIFVFWFVTAYFNRSSPKINTRLATVGVSVVVIFSLIGNLRSQIVNYVITGKVGPLINQFETKGFALIIPNEFTAVLFTAKKYFSQLLQNKIDLEYGYTLWQGIPYLFPRSVYDIFNLVKSSTIADNFGMYMANELGALRKVGFGMSIIGENIKNFGYFAIFTQLIELFILFLIIKLVGKLHGMQIVSVALISIFFLINRVAFASAFSMIVWVTFISFFFILAYSPIAHFFKSKHRSMSN